MFSMLDWTEGLEYNAVFSSIKEDIFTDKISKYVKHNIPGPGIDIEDFETSLTGCECKSICTEGNCPCIDQFGASYNSDKRIFIDFLKNGNIRPVFECNNNCQCKLTCCNRVAQHGVAHTCKLEVFVTENKGLGLQTLEIIPCGQFVCEYAGEIISFGEAKQRTASLKDGDMNYILTVNEHCKNEIMKTYVDPTYYGNIGRYINHSCTPNLMMIPVRVNNMIPLISLFALRDIQAMEELTFTYGHVEKTSSIKESEDKDKILKPCYCKSENCSGFLPFDHSLFNS